MRQIRDTEPAHLPFLTNNLVKGKLFSFYSVPRISIKALNVSLEWALIKACYSSFDSSEGLIPRLSHPEVSLPGFFPLANVVIAQVDVPW